MPTKQLEANVRDVRGAAVIDLRGEIHAGAEETLNAAYATADSHNPQAILLNFSEVGYINSTGIALIVGLLRQAREANRRLMACGLSEHYVEIFQITRLAEFMGVFPDEASALAEV
jgi:anti-anti-sigma factor